MSIQSFCNQEIQYFPRSGYDKYGKEVVTPGVSYLARVQNVSKTRFLANGQQVTIDLIIYIDGSVIHESDTELFLVGERLDYQNIPYQIHGKKTAHDEQGSLHHVKLELKKWNI